MSWDLDREAYPLESDLGSQGPIELRFTHPRAGRMVSMVVQPRAVSKREPNEERPAGGFYLELDVIGVRFADLSDAHIERQRSSIEHLLAHVQAHCPEMRLGDDGKTLGECAHMRRERERANGQ